MLLGNAFLWRFSLVPRTCNYTSIAITDYVAHLGRMPKGWDDLVEHGLLTQNEDGYYLHMDGFPRALLAYHEAISVNWNADLQSLCIKNNTVSDAATGAEVLIIRCPSYYCPSQKVWQIRIMEAFRDRVTDWNSR